MYRISFFIIVPYDTITWTSCVIRSVSRIFVFRNLKKKTIYITAGCWCAVWIALICQPNTHDPFDVQILLLEVIMGSGLTAERRKMGSNTALSWCALDKSLWACAIWATGKFWEEAEKFLWMITLKENKKFVESCAIESSQEWMSQLKNPIITSGIEIATFRLAAYSLNQPCYREIQFILLTKYY